MKLAEIYDVSVSWLLGEGADKLDIHDDKIQLAARELQKLKPDNLDRLLTICVDSSLPPLSLIVGWAVLETDSPTVQ